MKKIQDIQTADGENAMHGGEIGTLTIRRLSFVFLASALLLNVFGQIAARLGAGDFVTSWQINLWIFVSYCCLVLRGFLWALSLREIPLSFAYPMFSVNFLLVLGAAALIFDERITLGNILGSCCIMLGLGCIALGEKRRGT